MAHLRYCCERTKDGEGAEWQFRCPEKASLPQILVGLLREKHDLSKQQLPFTWHVRAEEILGRLEPPSGRSALVIHVNESSRDWITLCELKDVWGYSYGDWTPIALGMECLIDQAAADPGLRRQTFTCARGSGEKAYTFLYLRAGTVPGRGKRAWGKVGYVNAALLWRDALEWFVAQMCSKVPGA